VIGGGRGQFHSNMEIDLLLRRGFACHAELQQVPGASLLGRVAGVFDERIQASGQLPVQQERGLTRYVPAACLRGPVDGEHPRRGPVL